MPVPGAWVGILGSRGGGSEREIPSGSESDSESGSHSSKMERRWTSVLKSRMPWPRSLMPGFRIHHSWQSGGSVLFRSKLSCSS